MTDIVKSVPSQAIVCIGRVCNFCGKEDRDKFPSGLSIVATARYGSDEDGREFHFWCCDECFEKNFKGKENIKNIVVK